MVKKILKLLYKILPWKQHLFSLVKRIYHPPHNIYKHLHFKGIFEVKVDNSKFLLKHYGYQIENAIFWEGIESWEKVSIRLWIEVCKRSNVILDVGANTGIYSLVAKTVNPNANVYAFEPVTRVFDKLMQNVELNHYPIKCYEVAVSNYNGKAVIYDQATEHILSVTVNKNIHGPSVKVIEREVQTITLDSFIKRNHITQVDVIKIDVETHEPEVLEGLKSHLSQFRPTLLIEVLNEEVGSRIESQLAGLGYLYFDIDEESKPRQVKSLTKSSYYNFIICTPEVATYLDLL